jgi:6-phosphogluconolactonase
MEKRSLIKTFQFMLLVIIFLFSCNKGNDTVIYPSQVAVGSLFVQTNETAGNRVLQYDRTELGKLTYVGSYDTKGFGTGTGLGNQGSIILSEDKKFLLVTNAQSNNISTFKFNNDKLIFVGIYPSMGVKPISITQKGNIVYVLNVTSDKIAGFFMSDTGELSPISGSIQSLSGTNVLGAQISFVHANVLVVTERQSNKISTFVLNSIGVAGNRQTANSYTNTPFGFGVGTAGRIYITEENLGLDSGGQLSSYVITPSGAINFLSTFHSGELGICWAVVNTKETTVFATNTATSTISSFGLAEGSGVIKKHFIAKSLGSGFAPIDIALSKKDDFLYVLNAKSNKIIGYAITASTLMALRGGEISELPKGANGLAVY